MKILSPVGNFESLKMAVYNGADEVYLGINNFNARNNIDGFDIEGLKEAVDFSHVFDVRVLLAINILFSDEELQNALDIVVDSYNIGVDAFIIQDLGLASLLHEKYPEIEIHASTQMGIHNLEGVQEIEKYGFKRVVLARETPLEEIKRIKENTNLEIEYFVQGALCVSFSGNCYLSSYLCNASGNRGKCKQLCRLPYTFLNNGKIIKKGYLLSAKDFNLINRLKELRQAGVDVLKIEGRARRPFYVGATTREYRNALNAEEVNEENLKLAFNRNYTAGYFDGNGMIISDIQNHIGICIGKIEKVGKGKKFNEVYFSSNRKLSPKSTFKIFDDTVEKTTLTAYDLTEIGKGKYKLTTTQKVDVGDIVHLIQDFELEQLMLKSLYKREIFVDLFAQIGKPIKAIIYLNNKEIEVLGAECLRAIRQPVSQQEIYKNFDKNGLLIAKLNLRNFDEFFMPKQQLNEFRRKVYEKIFNELTSLNRNKLQKTGVKIEKNIKKLEDFQIIEKINEKMISKNIIYSPSEYLLEDIQKICEVCKNLGKQLYLDTPNFALEKDIKLLKNIINQTKVGVVANNYYALELSVDLIIGAGLNVYNSISAQVFDKPVITSESNIAPMIKYPYMTLRHCPLKSHMKANCMHCPYNGSYAYKMDNGKMLKLKRKRLTTCTFYLTD